MQLVQARIIHMLVNPEDMELRMERLIRLQFPESVKTGIGNGRQTVVL